MVQQPGSRRKHSDRREPVSTLSVLKGFAQRLVLPNTVKKCLKDKNASNLKVLTDKDPYLLKGYFDGDTEFDYALHIRAKNGETGVLICLGNGTSVLLDMGVDGKKIADIPDNWHWKVLDKWGVMMLRKWQSSGMPPLFSYDFSIRRSNLISF
jgi:hypothetical protein